MSTKFGTFISEKKIDPRRVIAASNEIERLRREDRMIRLAKRAARKSEDAAKKKEGADAPKPRTGRPVTQRSINAALEGKPLSGPIKTRLLRAVNYLLEQKKQEKVDLKALFEAPAKGGKAEQSGDEAAAS